MKRPNILIIYTDQQRGDALGASGNAEIQTPHLDAVARDGIHFSRCYVQSPVCMPSRVSFLSGQYPGTLGITHMGVPVSPSVPVLPHFLQNYGYHCANIGKLHFLPHANRDHRTVHPPFGFDQLEISDEPGCYPDAYRAWVAAKSPDQLDLISCGLPPDTEVWQRTMGVSDDIVHPAEREPKTAQPFRADSNLTHSAFVAEQTMDYLRSRDESPFLCIAGFYSPHSPWIAPQEFLDLYDPQKLELPDFPEDFGNRPPEAHFRAARHGYYAMISEVDHHVGRILGCLNECGKSENTIVVFTSDHGEWLGEHGRWGKSYPAHDAVSNVPLLMRWPNGLAESGREVSNIVEAVDVVPTLLEAAAIPLPPQLQGQSLLAPLQNRNGEMRTSALTEHDDWKALHTGEFRYLAHRDGRESLFDLQKPLGEYRDVAGEPDYGKNLAAQRHELLQRLLSRERPLPRVWTY